MIPLAHSPVFCAVHWVGRILCGAAALALLACWTAPQCIAAKLLQHRTRGVYLEHDEQVLQVLAKDALGTYWIDGYQMAITKQTQICWHDSPLQFGPTLDRDGQSIPKLKATSPCESVRPGSLKQSAWLQYLGIQKYIFDYLLTPKMSVVATRVDVWRSVNNGNQTQVAPKQTWRTLCASASSHNLRYPNEGPIDVVCDQSVNSYVESVFSSLQRPSAVTQEASISEPEIPTFYVVKPFWVRQNYDFEAFEGSTANCGIQGSLCTYQRPHADSTDYEIAYAPDGAMLIPDTVFAHLTNEAEFAALLSYSLAATDQHLIERLFRAQHYMGGRWSFSGRRNGYWIDRFLWNLNEQVLRLGIPQMYLAGYDVRYAPCAWNVELGEHIKGSIITPDYKHMPVFAIYAFNDISQFYSDVDFSKLKRGEAEYAQFLDELRKADPEAFEDKK